MDNDHRANSEVEDCPKNDDENDCAYEAQADHRHRWFVYEQHVVKCSKAEEGEEQILEPWVDGSKGLRGWRKLKPN